MIFYSGMLFFLKLRLYFNTLKYITFKQMFYRLYYRLSSVRHNKFDFEPYTSWTWNGPFLNDQSLFENNDVIFLNNKGFVQQSSDWNCITKDKLWLYNLHYFDDLSSVGCNERFGLQNDFINLWIDQNEPFYGNGWEPYPISIRLVNWVKWCSLQSDVSNKILASMLLQADALKQQLEFHILGNHLFTNCKALIFVGVFFEGEHSARFLDLGLKIIDEELDVQFLEDGAHFELSPMYHQILLWDLLELIGLANTSQHQKLLKVLPKFKGIAEKALHWLSSMIHTDGEVSFFNDSSIGIAKTPEQIFAYAKDLDLDLDLDFESNKRTLLTHENSGYSRVTQPLYSLLFDHANVGPDYLPGHAHADTLSFELSISKQRVFVNSGTSLYGTSAERLRQRQTPAHNTVSVEGLDSSQVWSGFRVAKRAYSKLIKSSLSNGVASIEASHDGYLKQSPKVTHTRKLHCSESSIVIVDTLSSPRRATYNLHIHPSVIVNQLSDNKLSLSLNDTVLCYFESPQPIRLTDSTWHPEFGKSIPNKKIEIDFDSGALETCISMTENTL